MTTEHATALDFSKATDEIIAVAITHQQEEEQFDGLNWDVLIAVALLDDLDLVANIKDNDPEDLALGLALNEWIAGEIGDTGLANIHLARRMTSAGQKAREALHAKETE